MMSMTQRTSRASLAGWIALLLTAHAGLASSADIAAARSPAARGMVPRARSGNLPSIYPVPAAGACTQEYLSLSM